VPTLPLLSRPDCRECEFHGSAQHVGLGGRCVRRSGDDRAVLVVGQSPGQQEDDKGEIFVGPSGELLEQGYLPHLKGDVWVTNAVRCRPPYKVDPTGRHVRACAKWLREDIKALQEQYREVWVLCVGKQAAMSMLGVKSLKDALSMQGKLVKTIPYVLDPLARPVRVYTTFHPAFLLREPSSAKDAAVEDHLAYMAEEMSPTFEAGGAGGEVPVVPLDEFHEVETSWESPLWVDIETYGIFNGVEQTAFHPVLAKAVDGVPASRQIVSVALCGKRPSGLVATSAVLAARVGQGWEEYPEAAAKLQGVLERFIEAGAVLGGTAVLFDLGFLAARFPSLDFGKARFVDFCVASFVQNPERPEMSLKDLAPLLLHGKGFRYQEKGKKYDRIEDIVPYNIGDVTNPAQGYMVLQKRALNEKCQFLRAMEYYDKVLHVLHHMSKWGMHVETEKLRAMTAAWRKRAERIQAWATDHGLKLAGTGSQKAVAEIFAEAVFLAQGVDWEMTTGGSTGARKTVSTAKANLRRALAAGLPRPLHRKFQALQGFRKAQKLVASYLEPWTKATEKQGAFYPKWFPVPSRWESDAGLSVGGGTRQVRVTCREPALQTAPRVLRKVFRSRYPQGVLMAWDHNQLEVRVAAWVSGDPEMRRIYEQGLDIHHETLEYVMGRKVDRGEPRYETWRRNAKYVVFGSIYGAGAETIAETVWRTAGIALPLKEAQRFLDGFREKFRVFVGWQQMEDERARKEGGIFLPITGQWRPFGERGRGSDKATYNMRIQSEAANILLQGQWTILQRAPEVVMPLNVYDAVLTDFTSEERARAVAPVVRECLTENWYVGEMERAYGTRVPMKVDSKVLWPTTSAGKI